MSALNQNYATALAGFTADKGNPQCYQAASAGAFNQTASGALAAYALFWISGDVQSPGDPFDRRQFIWGNLDDDNSTGWGIYLEDADDDSGQMVLNASLYAPSGLRNSQVLLSGPDAGGGSFIERLICAGLWYDGGNLVLSVNGALMPADEHGAEAYAPSAVAALLGGDAAGDNPATNVRIVSAGYAPTSLEFGFGALASSHFQSCRESLQGGYLIQLLGVDWAHRYEAAASVPAGTSGTISKVALGPAAVSAPVAPTQLTDQGNLGPTPFAGTSPVALNRLGVLDLNLDQVAQPDWYDAAAFEFAAPVPA